MAKSLRELIQQFWLSAEQVAASSKELTESTYQTNDATKQIAVTMQRLANGVDQQVSSLTEAYGDGSCVPRRDPREPSP